MLCDRVKCKQTNYPTFIKIVEVSHQIMRNYIAKYLLSDDGKLCQMCGIFGGKKPRLSLKMIKKDDKDKDFYFKGYRRMLTNIVI